MHDKVTDPKQVRRWPQSPRVPLATEVAARIANSIGPAFDGFAPRSRHAAVGSRARELSAGAAREGVEMSERTGLDVAGVGRERDRGDASCPRVEVTQVLLDRIAQWQPRAQRLHGDRGGRGAGGRRCRRRARSPTARPKGALHGVPLAHKDMYYDAGKVATCGSKIRRRFRSRPTTSTALQRLKDAGTFRLGSLQMVEFAYGPTGHNRIYGAVRNPWNVDHITGGSSSGSGSAVARAADLCGARLRHRRLDPDARAFLRRHRLQDRRSAASAAPARCRCRSVARYGRAAGADRGGLRAAASG